MSDVTKLGVLLDETAQRDAVHVAVAPVVAGETLAPGDHIMINQNGEAVRVSSRVDARAVGIVDPFLTTRVMADDRFWLFLYPGTITSLRHQWTHPAFDAPAEQPTHLPPTAAEQREASEKWLREYASTHDVPGYDIMMEEVDKHVNDKIYVDWVTIHGYSAYDQIPPEFWTHYENVRGKRVDDIARATSFSCSC